MLKPYQDPNHEMNGPQYRSGKKCIEGCGRDAGTAWGPHWCQPCNVVRLGRITANLESIVARFNQQ